MRERKLEELYLSITRLPVIYASGTGIGTGYSIVITVEQREAILDALIEFKNLKFRGIHLEISPQ